jgi:hypothetical protein
MHHNRLISVLAMAVLAGACASSGQPQSSPRRDSNIITAEELATLTVNSALEAVRQLRPAWLRRRGSAGTAVVYRNNARWSDTPEGLDSIELQSIIEMRFMSAADATTRYGSGFQGGLILVTTR